MNPKLFEVIYLGQKRVFIFSLGDIFLVKEEGKDIDSHVFVKAPTKEEIMEHLQKKEL